jgi:hypothetical protein
MARPDPVAVVAGPAGGRRARRRARATVLSAIFTLIGLTAGLAFLAERRPGIRDPLWAGKEDGLVRRFDRPEPDAIKVVALGSSRTANTFHPPTAEAAITRATGRPCVAFNAAVIGNGPVSQLVHLRRMLARGVRADVIVVEVVPALFAERGGGTANELGLRVERLSRADVEMLADRGYVDDEFESDWAVAAANPWYSLRFQLVGPWRPKWLPPGAVRYTRKLHDPGGWLPWEEEFSPAKYRSRLAGVRAEYGGIIERMHLADGPLRAYRETVEECRASGAIPVTVVSPESSDFRSWYSPESRKTVAELLAAIRASGGGPVVDAREWLPDTAFADGHHVLSTAAAGFTERFVAEAILPAVSGPTPPDSR